MKVIVTARVRDESHNVHRFCSHYAWADKILLSDGGSVDDTKEKASKYSNVEIRDFTERIQMHNGLWRNPHGSHINSLITWAEALEADWIIFDDFDSVPNNQKIRKEEIKRINWYAYDYIRITRLYLWGASEYFPGMSKDEFGNWTHAVWAWRANKHLRYKEDNPLKQEYEHVPDKNFLDLNPEYCCLLHYSWTNKEILDKKLKFYRQSGQHPDMKHPLEFAGKLEKLPWWANSYSEVTE